VIATGLPSSVRSLVAKRGAHTRSMGALGTTQPGSTSRTTSRRSRRGSVGSTTSLRSARSSHHVTSDGNRMVPLSSVPSLRRFYRTQRRSLQSSQLHQSSVASVRAHNSCLPRNSSVDTRCVAGNGATVAVFWFPLHRVRSMIKLWRQVAVRERHPSLMSPQPSRCRTRTITTCFDLHAPNLRRTNH